MAKQPPKFGPVTITKGQMQKGDEFYARQEERRGTRKALDEALSLALWVDVDRLAPMARTIFDAKRALVLKALADDPLGIIPASPEVEEACRWLSNTGVTARSQATIKKNWSSQGGKGRTAETDDGIANLKAYWSEQGWDLDQYKPYDTGNTHKVEKSAEALGVDKRTIGRYIARYMRDRFPEMTKKRRRRAPSSETPQKKIRHIVRHIVRKRP